MDIHSKVREGEKTGKKNEKQEAVNYPRALSLNSGVKSSRPHPAASRKRERAREKDRLKCTCTRDHPNRGEKGV